MSPSLTEHLPSRSTTLWLGGAIFISALLSLLFVGSESFTSDEAYSFFYSQLGLSHMWTLLGDHMPLYYVLLKAWSGIVGTSDAALRSLSALFAIASVPLLYRLASRLFDKRISLIACWLFATNSFVLFYAQNARSYSLVLLLCICSSYFFVSVIESHPTTSGLVWYALTSISAVYAHAFAIWILVAHGLSLVFLRRNERPLRELAFVYGVVAAAITPLLVASYGTRSSEAWVSHPTLRQLVYVLFKLVGGQEAYGFPLLALFGVFALLGLRRANSVIRLHGTSIASWRFGLVAAWLLVPVAGAFVISFARPMFVERYLIVVLPSLIMIIAVGLASLSRRWLIAATGTLAAALLAANVYVLLAHRDNEDWRDAAAFFVKHEKRGDALILIGGAAGLAHYLPHGDWSTPQASGLSMIFPSTLEPLAAPGAITIGQVIGRSEKSPRIWVIARHSIAASAQVRGWLNREGYKSQMQRQFKGIEVDLLGTQRHG